MPANKATTATPARQSSSGEGGLDLTSVTANKATL